MGDPGYKRLSDFDVTNPQELRRDLQQMDRQIALAFSNLPKQPFDSVRHVNNDTAGRLGELLIVDTSQGIVKVTLPQVSSLTDKRLQTFGVIMASASNSCILQCVGSDTVDRQASQTLSGSIGLAAYVVFDGLEYWT